MKLPVNARVLTTYKNCIEFLLSSVTLAQSFQLIHSLFDGSARVRKINLNENKNHIQLHRRVNVILLKQILLAVLNL